MPNATFVLILGGLGNLVFAAITGMLLGMVRAKEPVAPKYLNAAHVGSTIWAPLLLSVVVVLPVSSLSPDLESVAALCLVLSSVLIDVKDLWNWLRGSKDEFGEKAPPVYLGYVMTPIFVAGIGLLIYGVV